jgi:phosphatidylglycerol:prolipoprotein diacylglycerol transferase
MLAYYLHNLSPFLIRFGEKFGLRWYGLAYVAAFVVGFLLLRSFVRRGYCELRESQVSDFITLGALLGVMLGGRLGYMLFYDFDRFIAKPTIFFNFLDGGMASLGGILGLVIFTFIFARRKHVTWRGIGDNLCTVAPLGLCFGRLANFINGELYGRKADVAWAVQFPEEIREHNFQSPTGADRADLDQALAPFEFPPPRLALDGQTIIYDNSSVIEASRHEDGVADVLREYLNARHPSQLYQALMEGLALFLILYIVRVRFPRLRHGILTGLFFIGYATFRILGEQFREPSDGYIGIFTRGQFLSLFMFAVGGAFLLSAVIWPYQQKDRRRISSTAAADLLDEEEE